MRKIIYILGVAIGAAILLLACKPDTECRQTEAVRLKCLLSCDSITQDGDTVGFTLDSLTVQGVGSDSVLIDNRKSVSSISLPLRKDTTITQFALTCNEQTDTLVVYHQNDETFISLACGCFVYHTIDEARHKQNLITDIEILNSDIVNYEQDNLQINLLFR